MRIVCTSDVHNKISKAQLEPGDLLVISGDLTSGGKAKEIIKFNEDLAEIKSNYKYGIVLTPGNHDFMFQDYPDNAKLIMTNATVLIDDYTIINGYKIYGSPWQPWYQDWAFNFPEHYKDPDGRFAFSTWGKIPEDTDILLTHSPAYNMLDKVLKNSGKNQNNNQHVGCPYLAKRINELKQLKLHVFGHIHESYGKVGTKDTIFVNACACDLTYEPNNPAWVIDL